MRQRAAGRADDRALGAAALNAPRRTAPRGADEGDERRQPGPTSALKRDGAYRRFPLPAAAVECYEGRYELWDRATETAYMVREPSPSHERSSQALAGLVERIAAVRGKAIRCYGAMNLALRGEDGRLLRIMQADQSVYLHPDRADLAGRLAMVVGEHSFPDVVLEVDHTTDVRRHKLALYEAWGFPEVWVDVPEDAPRRRTPPGATIRVLAGTAYEVAQESRAFAGWTAAEIHLALNEQRLSERTVATLERIGAALGEREGTGPQDDPLLRSQRRQAAAQAVGEARQRLVRQLLVARGLAVGEGFPMAVPGFGAATLEQLANAAARCEDEADFAARLRGPAPDGGEVGLTSRGT